MSGDTMYWVGPWTPPFTGITTLDGTLLVPDEDVAFRGEEARPPPADEEVTTLPDLERDPLPSMVPT